MDDFLSNFVLKKDEKELSNSKKDILKFLKRIGVDTRFVSYFEDDNEKGQKPSIRTIRILKL